MKDKIKEILDKLRSDDYYEKEYQKSVYYERDLKKLEDYITNLQEENKNLKLSLKDRLKYSDELDEKISRIDKAVEIYKNRHTCKYKKERFMKDKSTSDLMYETLTGGDDNE